MAKIRLNNFDINLLDNATLVSNPPTLGTSNIDYNAIKNQVGSDGNDSTIGKWFELEKSFIPSDYPEDIIHKNHGDYKKNIQIYCKTILVGNKLKIDKGAKLCGAPEPPFQGDQTEGKLNYVINRYSNTGANNSKNKLDIIFEIISKICNKNSQSTTSPEGVQSLQATESMSKIIEREDLIKFYTPFYFFSTLEDSYDSSIKFLDVDDLCCHIISNFFVRQHYSEKSFEYELLLFAKNIMCCNCKNCNITYKYLLLYIIFSYLYLVDPSDENDKEPAIDEEICQAELEKYSHFSLAQYYYKKLNIDEVEHEDIKQLILAMNDIQEKNLNIDLSKIQILVSINKNNFKDGTLISNIINSNLVEYNNVNIFISHNHPYENFKNQVNNWDVIFFVGHGNDDNGIMYYNCNQSDYIKKEDLDYNKGKLFGFFACTHEPYLKLANLNRDIILPSYSISSFEHAEMFIKSLLGTYKQTGNLTLAYKIATYAGQIFPYKRFKFEMYL